MVTLADCNTVEVDGSANTRATVATLTIPADRGGRIKYIRLSGGCVGTTAVEVSGYLELDLASHSGPYRFPVFAGEVDADLGVGGISLAESIPVDIPVHGSEVVTIYMEMTGAFTGVHGGIVWEAEDS